MKLMYDTKMVFIVLGYNCNLQCDYCCQHLHEYQPPTKIKKDIFDFIDGLITDKYKLDIRFFGGEPLMYWDEINQFVNYFHNKNVSFSMITNGKLLDKEKIEFINKYRIYTAVSWDGKDTINTRHYDVIKEKKDLLLVINLLSITGVLSKANYPLDFFNSLLPLQQEFFAIHKYFFGIGNTMILEHDVENINPLANINTHKLYEQSQKMCNMFYNHYLNNTLGEISAISLFIQNQLINTIRINDYTLPCCSLNRGAVNMNLNGDIYDCHNTKTVIGNIHSNLQDLCKPIRDNSFCYKLK